MDIKTEIVPFEQYVIPREFTQEKIVKIIDICSDPMRDFTIEQAIHIILYQEFEAWDSDTQKKCAKQAELLLLEVPDLADIIHNRKMTRVKRKNENDLILRERKLLELRTKYSLEKQLDTLQDIVNSCYQDGALVNSDSVNLIKAIQEQNKLLGLYAPVQTEQRMTINSDIENFMSAVFLSKKDNE